MFSCVGWDVSHFMRVTTTCWPWWDGRDIWDPSGVGVLVSKSNGGTCKDSQDDIVVNL